MFDPELVNALRQRRRGFVLVTGSFAITIVLGIWFAWSIRPLPFSHADWHRHSERSRMIDDLLRNHLFQGASIDNVKALLGLPDRTSGESYVYVIDSESDLEIKFSDGHVTGINRPLAD